MKPEVGMGVTWGFGSDRYPGTIVKVSDSGKTVWFQRDYCDHVSGSFFTNDAVHTFHRNIEGELVKATLRRNGRYHMKGCSMRYGSIIIGTRDYYQDPHF